jgi:hypothetical protein
MNSFRTAEFRELLDALPLEIQQLAKKNYNLWRDDMRHPSIHFKSVGGDIWSA